jgi:hypothetical protein
VAESDALLARGNPQRSALRHRVVGVHGEVQERHLELVGVAIGRRQIIGDLDRNLDLRPGRAADQVGHTCHEVSTSTAVTWSGWRRAKASRR